MALYIYIYTKFEIFVYKVLGLKKFLAILFVTWECC